MQGYNAFLNDVTLVNVDEQIAHRAVMPERVRRGQGHNLGVFALVISATALERGLELVTHVPAYQAVPGLTLRDWTVP
jgi:predicted nucleic acid-binding protein